MKSSASEAGLSFTMRMQIWLTCYTLFVQDPTAKIGEGCRIGPNVVIGPGAVIQDGKIGSLTFHSQDLKAKFS